MKTEHYYQNLAQLYMTTVQGIPLELVEKGKEIDLLLAHNSWDAAEGCIDQFSYMLNNVQLSKDQHEKLQQASIQYMFAAIKRWADELDNKLIR